MAHTQGENMTTAVTQRLASHFDPHALRARVTRLGGFVSAQDVTALAAHPTSRLWPCLVRCGGGRFVAPADQVAHFIRIITAEGSDYVRDVSLMAEWGR